MAEFNLQTALGQIRDRRSDASVREQKERNAAGRLRLDPNSPEVRRARAAEQQAALLDELTYLEGEPDSQLRTQRMNRIFDRVAELCAEQGDYAAARLFAVDQRRRGHYTAIQAAIERNDDENCECTNDLIVDRKKNQEIKSPAMMTVEQVITADGLKNRELCRKCGFQNVR